MPPSQSPLYAPLTLPNGVTLPNRLVKAAMEENLASPGQLPGMQLRRLYRAWGEGGVGLILTGNVMIDPTAMTGPGGVVLDAEQPLEPFQAWAMDARSGGARVWMQISHPGRQVYAAMGQDAVAPSAIRVDVGRHSRMFATPRALTVAGIETLVARFATTASLAEKAGFDGVQIHGAHGYLLSQFLSPLTNRRRDEWGGDLEGRARFLLAVVRAVRARVSPGFAVSVKLNSADFQKGGAEPEDATRVVEWLNDMRVDMVELSGGSYEVPAMGGVPSASARTLAREAYFIDFARDIAAVARMPVMVTGGITSRAVAEAALRPDGNRRGMDLIGIASALAFDPALPRHWRDEAHARTDVPRSHWRASIALLRPLAPLADMALVKRQLDRIGAGRPPSHRVSPLLALIGRQIRTARQTRRYRAWVETRSRASSPAPPTSASG